MFYPSEMDFIYFIQQFRTPIWDAFFKFLNYFDRQEFFLILLPALWFGIHWKAGVRIFYLLVFNNLLNHFLKGVFAHPRPSQIDPSVGIFHFSSYGFPSGAAQTVALLSGLLIFFWKSPWKWLVASLYFVLISFSRLYLGVHFPSDIIGGWIFGFAILFVYLALQPLLAKLENFKPLWLFSLGVLVPLLLLLSSRKNIPIAATGLAISIGLFISYKWGFLAIKQERKIRVLRSIIGIVGLLGCYSLAKYLLPDTQFSLFIIYFLIGLWLSVFGNIFSGWMAQRNSA